MIFKVIVMIVALMYILGAIYHEHNGDYTKSNNLLLWAGILLICMILNTIS